MILASVLANAAQEIDLQLARQIRIDVAQNDAGTESRVSLKLLPLDAQSYRDVISFDFEEVIPVSAATLYSDSLAFVDDLRVTQEQVTGCGWIIERWLTLKQYPPLAAAALCSTIARRLTVW